ncbi:hypothetical protein [Microbacterium sp. SS28]|uniref:hypothetical protein n=1 Tax=Microbacterium sp. SS28 TaxID=2919948 RepID=UPI001FAAD2D7|nr:hypothetical protein [Microbacterium sp. SS28]
MTDDAGSHLDGAAVSGRSTAQIRTGRIGWFLWLILLIATGWQVMNAFGFLLHGAFGGDLYLSEVATWVTIGRILLVASIVCCVLGVIAERWVLFSLAVVITLVAVVMNLVEWNVGGAS